MVLTDKQIVGKIGESAVVKYIKKRGFEVLECNYLKKCGELDIVAWKIDKIHFIEVKSLSREIISEGNKGDHTNNHYRAEENVHKNKLRRIAKTIQMYLLENKVPDTIEWQFDIATVLVDCTKKLCRVSMLRDITI